MSKSAARDVADLVINRVAGDSLRVGGLNKSRGLIFNKVYSVCINDSMVLAFDSEVVGDEFDRSFGRGCHP